MRKFVKNIIVASIVVSTMLAICLMIASAFFAAIKAFGIVGSLIVLFGALVFILACYATFGDNLMAKADRWVNN